MKCPFCGTENTEYHVFCKNCRKPLEATSDSNQKSTQVPPKKRDTPEPPPTPAKKYDDVLKSGNPDDAYTSGTDIGNHSESEASSPKHSIVSVTDAITPDHGDNNKPSSEAEIPIKPKKPISLSGKQAKLTGLVIGVVLLVVLGVVFIKPRPKPPVVTYKPDVTVTAAPYVATYNTNNDVYNDYADTEEEEPVTFTSAPTPSPTPSPTPEPNPYKELKKKCKAYDKKVEFPLESEMLDEPLIYYVRGSNPNSGSGGMYLCRAPGEDSIRVVRPHSPVTIYAVRGSLSKKTGHAFVETTKGEFGWISFKATRGDGLSPTNDF